MRRRILLFGFYRHNSGQEEAELKQSLSMVIIRKIQIIFNAIHFSASS